MIRYRPFQSQSKSKSVDLDRLKLKLVSPRRTGKVALTPNRRIHPPKTPSADPVSPLTAPLLPRTEEPLLAQMVTAQSLSVLPPLGTQLTSPTT